MGPTTLGEATFASFRMCEADLPAMASGILSPKKPPMATIRWNGSRLKNGVMDRSARWARRMAAATNPR